MGGLSKSVIIDKNIQFLHIKKSRCKKLSKLDDFKLLLKKDADYMPAEYENDLFHYTSPTGFSSIMSGDLEQVTLWASRYDCLNDASEGTVVEEVYQEVCKELRDRDEITEYLYQLFIKVKTARTILLSYNQR